MTWSLRIKNVHLNVYYNLRRKKRLTRNKKAIAIALFLLFAMTVSLFSFPSAGAQGTRATYAFIGATPNPVGINQETLLHIGITQQLNSVAMGWEGLSVTVTKPDGTTETISNIRTDSTGGTGYVYTPTMAGNYTLQTHFPAQNTTSTKQAGGTPVGTWMLASDSAKLTLVVMEMPVAIYPGFPLPTEYWTRPINSQLREWAPIAQNWPNAPPNGFITYDVDAPETAHILWTKQIAMGGLAGGDIEGINGPGIGFEVGAAYEQKFGAPVILGGILFYNKFESRGQPYVETTVVAVDLHTGEEMWSKPLIGRTGNTTGATVAAADRMIDGVSAQFPDGIGRRLNNGQLFYWQSYNYMGAYALLWTVSGSTWMAFDAFTGRWIYTITNSPATTGSYHGLGSNTFFGTNGEILAYTINQAAGWIALWNSSNLVSQAGGWNPHGNVYNATGRTGGALATGPARAWQWNITIPKGLPGSVRGVALGDRVVGSNVNLTDVNIWAFSLKKGQEGQLLFNNDWKAPTDWNAGNQTISWIRTSLEDNVGIVDSKETMQYWGFSLETGQYLWGPTEPEQYLQYLGTSTAVAYGKFYSTYMCGIVYCYDIQTGKLLWTHAVTDPLNEILWSPNWPVRIQFIADGKIYLCEGEHSPNIPLPRGAPYLCLNATTGEQIWSISITYYYRTDTLIGDNIIAVDSLYDNSIYAIGMGPSATTVSASPKVSVHGSSVLVEGMVTDISPGTKEYARTSRFPNGVPAVSDESMSKWMEYVYEQFPRPSNATGVEVVVSVLDPNNNYYEVGTATSDASGMFKLAFTPEVPGEYTVIASFEGSKAYYGSFAESAINVEEAPAATPPPTPTPAPMTDTYVTGFGIGIIIAIVVGFALLLLKKR
jgi:outer membrane protein assembly factor BamB